MQAIFMVCKFIVNDFCTLQCRNPQHCFQGINILYLVSYRKALYSRVYNMQQPLMRGSNGLYEEANKMLCPGLTWKGAFPLLSKAYHVTKDEKLTSDLKYLNRKVSFIGVSIVKGL